MGPWKKSSVVVANNPYQRLGDCIFSSCILLSCRIRVRRLPDWAEQPDARQRRRVQLRICVPALLEEHQLQERHETPHARSPHEAKDVQMPSLWQAVCQPKICRTYPIQAPQLGWHWLWAFQTAWVTRGRRCCCEIEYHLVMLIIIYLLKNHLLALIKDWLAS